MIRACPKCGDYYADDSLAFCLSDGTPLVNVDPLSESWSEAARVVENKEQALKRQSRRLKWRRGLMRAMTMLMMTMVVCVLVVNSYIYLQPKPEEVAQVKPSTPATDDLNPAQPVQPDEPVPSPSPRPTETPTPSPVTTTSPLKIDAPDSSPSPSVYPSVPATPSPSVSPSPSPHVTDTTASSTADATPCSEDDKRRERVSIVGRYGGIWQQNVEGEQSNSIAGKVPARAENVKPILSAPRYEIAFSETCAEASVTVSYTWAISYQEINATPIGTTRTPKMMTVDQSKSFRCVKAGGSWRCR